MKLIKFTINTGFVGGVHEGEFEVEDDAKREEIDQMVADAVWDYIEFSWEEAGE